MRSRHAPDDKKVVPLRGGQPPRVSPAGLSRSERQAFREIARALGARVEGDEEDASERNPLYRRSRRLDAGEATAEALTKRPSRDGGSAHAAHVGDEGRSLRSGEPDEVAGTRLPPSSMSSWPNWRKARRWKDRPGGRSDADQRGKAIARRCRKARPSQASLLTLSRPAEAAPALEPEIAAAPALSGLALHAELIFDRLPVGIIVSRGDVPIVMNRTLLDLLGYEDDRRLPRRRRDAHLFRGQARRTVPGAGEDRTVALTGRDAQIVACRRPPADDPVGRAAGHADVVQARDRARGRAAAQGCGARPAPARDRGAGAPRNPRHGHRRRHRHRRRLAASSRSTAPAKRCSATTRARSRARPSSRCSRPTATPRRSTISKACKSNGVASVLNDGREVIGRVRQGGRIPLFMTLGAVSDGAGAQVLRRAARHHALEEGRGRPLEAKRAAEQASAQKSDFLAKISHEIRTPLSAIIGFAEVMIEERFGPIGNERYLEYLRDIHASGGHVISLVNDLLDLSKIEAGRFDLTFVSVDVNEIVAARGADAAAGRRARGSWCARACAAPAARRGRRALAAPDRAQPLSNAMKFTDPGGQVIVSTALTDRGEVALRIRDTGIGMTREGDRDRARAVPPDRDRAPRAAARASACR